MKKAAKIIFYLSFLPAAGILLYAAVTMFTGIGILHDSLKGPGAVPFSIFYGGYTLLIIPVLPACVCYQAAYRLYGMFAPVTRGEKAAFFTVSAVLGVAVTVFTPLTIKWEVFIYAVPFVFFTVIMIFYIASLRSDEAAARKAYYGADERIIYGEKQESVSGIMGIPELQSSCILIDRSEKTVSFVTGDADGFCSFALTEDDGKGENYDRGLPVQAVFPLNDGGKLICFCPDEVNKHLTAALLLICGDGSGYYKDDMKDSNGDAPALGLSSAGTAPCDLGGKPGESAIL